MTPAHTIGAQRPRRQAIPARPDPAQGLHFAGELAGAVWRVVSRRPWTALGTVVVLGLGLSASWNVLMGQRARHPWPLFAHRHPDAAPRPADAPAAPLPVPRPEASALAAPAVAPKAGPDKAAAPKAGPDSDGIGNLIRTGDAAGRTDSLRTDSIKTVPAGKGAPRESVKADRTRMAAVQRALTKLGHPVTADGLPGPGTKAAIELFERERSLPVTGSLAPRTVRLLALRSGIRID